MEIETMMSIIIILTVVTVALTITIQVADRLSFKDRAQDQCKKLNMELFDYDTGNMFQSSSITCYDKVTKEIKIIK